MKKTVLCAAALCAMAPAAFAQSTVTMYGIVDVAVRSDTNAGAKGATSGDTVKTVAPGGMSQSRLGFTVKEDLGGGMAANANFEHRFNSDAGAISSATDFWRQSWVGLTTPYGQVMLGRQYNVLFDITTATFASFKYSPYIEAYKPEIAMSLGARTSNTVKYVLNAGGFRLGLAASAGEGGAGGSRGAYLRYENGPVAVGAGTEQLKDAKGNKVTGTVFGGAYTVGPVVLTAAWAKNNPDDLYDRSTLALSTGGAQQGGLVANAKLDSRTMYSLGAMYQATAKWNLGVNYWNAKDSAVAGATNAEGKARFVAFVADYAMSKRTDVYLELDNTKLSDGSTFANLETKRTGYMVGVRHRF